MDDDQAPFTQEELAALWRGRLTWEERARIRKETYDRINRWIDNLSPQESDVWISAYVDDLERKLRLKLES